MAGSIVFIIKNNHSVDKAVAEARNVFREEKFIIHACGTIYDDDKQYRLTNSREALINSYESGNRICEIDFSRTSDNKYVCAHNEKDTWVVGLDAKEPLTEEEYLNSRIRGVFHPIGWEELSAFMMEHKDFWIVTDVKDDNYQACKYIADNYPEVMDRVVVQIYHISEYDDIKSLGFDKFIYTLYATTDEERTTEALLDAIDQYDLVGMAFWESWLERDFYKEVKNTGIPLLVHTVNDAENIKADLEEGLLIYTDNTDNNEYRQ